jgi:hypothetical protein
VDEHLGKRETEGGEEEMARLQRQEDMLGLSVLLHRPLLFPFNPRWLPTCPCSVEDEGEDGGCLEPSLSETGKEGVRLGRLCVALPGVVGGTTEEENLKGGERGVEVGSPPSPIGYTAYVE